jgi:hypothetical protein
MNNGIEKLKEYFSQLTFERNHHSHPKMNKSEINVLESNFIKYCNDKWPNDSINTVITKNIFDELKSELN